MKLSSRDRTLLLLTTLLASYQVSAGIDGFTALPITAYTIAFGVILVAALLIFILGMEVLDMPIVVIVSTIIPLSLSVGLVWQHLASWRTSYLVFALIGFLAVTLTRSIQMQNKLPVVILAITHGVAGLTIFFLPIILAIQTQVPPLFALVGLGGGLIGIVGLLLSFQKTGLQIVSKENLMKFFPTFLLLTTALFVAGFKFGG
ncbi:MAG TPA: hypothetical protein PLQ75_12300 [Anaerolineales bacterium]|nr:hypothetical protein [Anaerolineales bacterium]HNF95426.1 hypothetical protein [Anaerolineales bacterium]